MTMLRHGTDTSWEKWGQENPYYGVLSLPQYLNSNLNETSVQEFFASGEQHVEHIYRVVHSKIRPDFHPESVLDYGCGVGRLVIPFARRTSSVVGVDISRSMLDEARKNAEKFGAASVTFIHADDLKSLAPGSFDLVHTFIVFQHIPVKRGEEIFWQLVQLLREGGVGALHLTFGSEFLIQRVVGSLRDELPLVNGLVNLAKGRKYSRPNMQMNHYPLDHIFQMLMELQCSNVHIEFSNHYGHLGVFVYFEKKSPNLL